MLISVDTLRADHLSSYGYSRETSPALSELAADGVLFEQARSQAPWTLPSMATLHTSMYPSQHGANKGRSAISRELPVLAEVLRKAGYRTLAVASHFYVGPKFGFARGYDEFEYFPAGHEGHSSQILTSKALELFEKTATGPKFLWIHYFDPHFSYVRHPEFGFVRKNEGRLRAPVHVTSLLPKGESGLEQFSAEDIDFVIGVYDEEVAFTDLWIGKLIRGARKHTDGRPIVFIVTADHGELFAERGRFGHSRDVYDELIRVPLIIGGDIHATWKGKRVARPVEVASIAKTVMGLAEIDSHSFRGEDLLIESRDPAADDAVFFEGGDNVRDDFQKVGVILDGLKLTHNLNTDGFELYDLRVDRGETKNLWDSSAIDPRARKLHQRLEKFREKLTGGSAVVEIDESTRARLRKLGYLDDEAPAP